MSRKSDEDGGYGIELVEYIDDTGRRIPFQRHEKRLSFAYITQGDRFKDCCKSCPSFGENLSCPPHSPSFLMYLDGCSHANVICFSVSTEIFDLPSAEERYRAGFRQAGSLLLAELLACRERGHLVAGSGPCLACEPCSFAEEDEATCRLPEKRVYSLESLGVDVAALVKSCFGFDLEWSDDDLVAGRVCVVGAFFL